jgi:hypothetical protein
MAVGQTKHSHTVLVALAAAAVYAPTMGNDYTLDDALIVETAPDRKHAPLTTLFDPGYFERYNQDTYRPTATFLSMLNHRIGIDPRHAGHAQSILWHVGAATLVHALAARFLPAAGALAAGLTFAVHPVGTEATVSIGYREDVIATALVVASLLLSALGGSRRRLAALAVYALALFAKENAVVLPALLVLMRLALRGRAPLDRRTLVVDVVTFGLVTVGYLAIRFGVMASPEAFADPKGGTYGDTLVAVPRIFAHYVRLLVVPWPLLVQYAHMFPFGASWSSQLPWLVLDLAFLVAAVRLVRSHPPIGFGLLWFAIALAPVLHIVPMRVSAADRFMHLPLAGGALAFGGAAALIWERAKRPAARRALAACGGAALALLVVLTERRISAWHDDLTLWRDTLAHNPRAYLGHLVLANDHADHGRPDLAGHELEKALNTCPRESEFGRKRFCVQYAVMLGFNRRAAGWPDAARAAFQEALALVPSSAPALVGLGYLHLDAGELGEASRHAQLAMAAEENGPAVRELVQSFNAQVARAAAASWTDATPAAKD